MLDKVIRGFKLERRLTLIEIVDKVQAQYSHGDFTYIYIFENEQLQVLLSEELIKYLADTLYASGNV